jgi:hypothetical protein
VLEAVIILWHLIIINKRWSIISQDSLLLLFTL